MENHIVLLHGKRGAGKSTIATLLKKRNNYIHIEYSKFLSNIKSSSDFQNMLLREYVELMMKKKGKNFFVEMLYEEIRRYAHLNIVITGIRHLSEIFILNDNNKNLYSFYVKVSFWKRLERVLRRKERSSFIQFIIEEYYSIKWGDGKIKKNASRIFTQNTSEDVYLLINKMLNNG